MRTNRTTAEFCKELQDQLYDKASAVLQSEDYGFPLDEIADVLFIDVEPVEDNIRAEVRAELSYEGMRGLANELDKIVSKYNKYAYFDDVTSGIIEAYIPMSDLSLLNSGKARDNSINSSKHVDYGGAYDIDPEMYFTRDDLVEFGSDVVDRLNELDHSYTHEIENIYMDTPNTIYISIEDSDGNTAEQTIAVDMRRIRKPQDLQKYEETVVTDLHNQFASIRADYETGIQSSTGTSGIPAKPVIGAYDDIPDDEWETADPVTYEFDLYLDGVEIKVEDNGSYDYVDNRGEFLKKYPNDYVKDGWYLPEYDVYAPSYYDTRDVLDDIDDLILDQLPAERGTYRLYGYVYLIYDIEDVYYNSDTDEYDADDAKIKFNKKLSEVQRFRYEKVD